MLRTPWALALAIFVVAATAAPARAASITVTPRVASDGAVVLSGSVTGRTPRGAGGVGRWRAELQERTTTSRRAAGTVAAWRTRSSARVTGTARRYQLRWKLPAGTQTLVVRVVIRSGRRVIATGTARSLRRPATVAPSSTVPAAKPLPAAGAPVGVAPGPTAAPARPAVASSPDPSQPEPLTGTAEATRLMAGSQQPIRLPAAIVAIERLDDPSSLPSGWSILAADGSVVVAAAAGADSASRTLKLTGTGCRALGDCGHEVRLDAPVTVGPLSAAPAAVDAFTAASPDRVLAGTAPPAGQEGAVLRDEVLITVGTSSQTGTRAQADAAAAAVGGLVTGGLEQIGVYELRWTTPQDVAARTAQLLAEPGVVSVDASDVGTLGPTAVPNDWNAALYSPTLLAQARWPHDQIRSPLAWDTTTGGPSVEVAIVDSGSVYADHEDLDVDRQGSDAGSPAGHATHVAGTACARGGNGTGIVGVAWGCKVASRRIGEAGGNKSLIYAMERAAATPGVRVVNMSVGKNFGAHCVTASEHADALREFGSSAANRELVGPLRAILDRGPGANIVWVTAAGNNCAPGVYGAWAMLGNRPNALVVAATNSDKTLARFSNYGDGVTIAAPGGVRVAQDGGDDTTGLLSTLPPFWRGNAYRFLGEYGTDDAGDVMLGTSMAAPHVAGAAALVRARYPGKSAAEVVECLVESAGTVTGYVRRRSGVPLADRFAPAFDTDGDIPAIPILDVAGAVACAPSPYASRTLISRGIGGGRSNGPVQEAMPSRDGHVVAFVSAATDLVAGDDDGVANLFVKNLTTGTVKRFPGHAAGSIRAVNTDGRFVLMSVHRPLVSSDTNDAYDVYVADTATMTWQRVSVSDTGAQLSGAGAGAQRSDISGDGRFVVFDTVDRATGDDVNSVDDVFVRDRTAGTTTRIRSVSGAEPNSDVDFPSISADGTKVAFYARASNFAPGGYGVLVRDLADGTTTRVAGGTGSYFTYIAISDDGRRVAYTAGSSGGTFVKDLHSGAERDLTRRSDGTDLGDGLVTTMDSTATKLGFSASHKQDDGSYVGGFYFGTFLPGDPVRAPEDADLTGTGDAATFVAGDGQAYLGVLR